MTAWRRWRRRRFEHRQRLRRAAEQRWHDVWTRREMDAAVWLPVTRPAPARPARISPPRVCAGRVTITEKVRALYDVAEATAAARLAAYSWPLAQEGTA